MFSPRTPVWYRYLHNPNPNPNIDDLNIDDLTVIGERPNYFGENSKFAFWKRGVYKVQGFENFSESGCL